MGKIATFNTCEKCWNDENREIKYPRNFLFFPFSRLDARLPSLDPFHEVNPLMIASLSINNDRFEEGCTLIEEDNDSEWEDPNDDRDAINFFDDENIDNWIKKKKLPFVKFAKFNTFEGISFNCAKHEILRKLYMESMELKHIFITLTINRNNKKIFEGVFNIYLFCFVFNYVIKMISQKISGVCVRGGGLKPPSPHPAPRFLRACKRV